MVAKFERHIVSTAFAPVLYIDESVLRSFEIDELCSASQYRLSKLLEHVEHVGDAELG
jgi:hypothetical protein